MKYKKVSRIKEEISVIGLGCWNFGGEWDQVTDEIAENIINIAIDKGINFFDIAPVYGFGHSEEVLGNAIKKNGKRNEIIIASKAGLIWNDKREITNDLSKESLLKEIDESLTRLQTDYIDIYQMHWPDPKVSLEETAEALKVIKDSGKIRYIGLTNFSIEDVKKMMTMIDIDCQQGLYNMLERNPVTYHDIPLDYRTEKEILPFVKEHGQAYLPYSPMFQGLLSGRFTRGGNFSKNDIRNANPKLVGEMFDKYFEASLALKDIADEYGKPMYQVALNWLRQKEEVTSIIGGVSSIGQLDKNIDCLSWDIEEQMMTKIDKVLSPFENI
jgi:aryl-alcohol dehydrogenase-like predicted oxidoreductase